MSLSVYKQKLDCWVEKRQQKEHKSSVSFDKRFFAEYVYNEDDTMDKHFIIQDSRDILNIIESFNRG